MPKRPLSWRDKVALDIHKLLGLSLHTPTTFGHNVITQIFKIIAAALHRGESVYVRGFGTFSIHTKPSRKTTHTIIKSGHQPVLFTEELIETKSRKYVHFAPCEALKAMVYYKHPNKRLAALIAKWNRNDN